MIESVLMDGRVAHDTPTVIYSVLQPDPAEKAGPLVFRLLLFSKHSEK